MSIGGVGTNINLCWSFLVGVSKIQRRVYSGNPTVRAFFIAVIRHSVAWVHHFRAVNPAIKSPDLSRDVQDLTILHIDVIIEMIDRTRPPTSPSSAPGVEA